MHEFENKYPSGDYQALPIKNNSKETYLRISFAPEQRNTPNQVALIGIVKCSVCYLMKDSCELVLGISNSTWKEVLISGRSIS